jgi:dsDNA-binding SOS-regulon protein
MRRSGVRSSSGPPRFQTLSSTPIVHRTLGLPLGYQDRDELRPALTMQVEPLRAWFCDTRSNIQALRCAGRTPYNGRDLTRNELDVSGSFRRRAMCDVMHGSEVLRMLEAVEELQEMLLRSPQVMREAALCRSSIYAATKRRPLSPAAQDQPARGRMAIRGHRGVEGKVAAGWPGAWGQ